MVNKIIALGAAMVDLLAPVSEAELAALGSTKGSMTLIDAAAAKKISSQLKISERQPGGSAANTIAGLAHLNHSTAFIGKCGDDENGAAFAAACKKDNTQFYGGVAASLATGHCLIAITPDGERTMHTHLGAAPNISEADIPAAIEGASLLFGEGFLWDSETAGAAFVVAAKRLKAANPAARVALSLSDVGVCERHNAALKNIIAAHVDIILANEAEAAALYGTNNINDSMAALQNIAPIIALTQSEKGALLADSNAIYAIPAVKIAQVKDTTGAGDGFAAGFLGSLEQTNNIQTAGEAGCKFASKIIQKIGARILRIENWFMDAGFQYYGAAFTSLIKLGTALGAKVNWE